MYVYVCKVPAKTGLPAIHWRLSGLAEHAPCLTSPANALPDCITRVTDVSPKLKWISRTASGTSASGTIPRGTSVTILSLRSRSARPGCRPGARRRASCSRRARPGAHNYASVKHHKILLTQTHLQHHAQLLRHAQIVDVLVRKQLQVCDLPRAQRPDPRRVGPEPPALEVQLQPP